MLITHVIIDLDVGGAELMLKRLIKSHQGKPNYRHSVISLATVGKIGKQLQEMGVEVRSLGMRSPLDIPHVLWQLVRMIRAERADIVQTWMYHADLLGGLAARLAGNHNVIWGVRGSAIPQKGLSATQVVVYLCSVTSRFIPKVIVCCAESARAAHIEKGYDKSKMVVVPNGYELSHIGRNPIRRQQTRNDFGFSNDDVVVGIVGRFDPLKDYKNFVRAATALASKVMTVKFLMIGRGIDSKNTELKEWLTEGNLAHKVVLTGERNDIYDCLAAMDVFCLSSTKEGFPNVVCEAMAMKVPCVVTDAGDAAAIVAETGIVVPTGDSKALARALQVMIEKGAVELSRLGDLARLRIENEYSMQTATARYENIYSQVTSVKPIKPFNV